MDKDLKRAAWVADLVVALYSNGPLTSGQQIGLLNCAFDLAFMAGQNEELKSDIAELKVPTLPAQPFQGLYEKQGYPGTGEKP